MSSALRRISAFNVRWPITRISAIGSSGGAGDAPLGPTAAAKTRYAPPAVLLKLSPVPVSKAASRCSGPALGRSMPAAFPIASRSSNRISMCVCRARRVSASIRSALLPASARTDERVARTARKRIAAFSAAVIGPKASEPTLRGRWPAITSMPFGSHQESWRDHAGHRSCSDHVNTKALREVFSCRDSELPQRLDPRC